MIFVTGSISLPRGIELLPILFGKDMLPKSTFINSPSFENVKFVKAQSKKALTVRDISGGFYCVPGNSFFQESQDRLSTKHNVTKNPVQAISAKGGLQQTVLVRQTVELPVNNVIGQSIVVSQCFRCCHKSSVFGSNIPIYS